ncbi:ribosome maturation factor RimP [Salinicoccus sp. HZC-1]|uniref:ribosome maturation factor RimP n=1 Tax=Salinicoccus sp. HZC-1 TaxID=3385497 RepID=UPI00398B56DC
MNRTEQNVMDKAQPVVETLGYKLIEVEYVKEGPDFYLRLYLDKKGGISLEDCAKASEVLSEKLDEWDLIKGGYYLDVSSPGAERPIKDDEDLEMTLDNGIYVKTYQQIAGEKEWTGILKEYDEKSVTLEYKVKTRTKTITIEREKIATIRKAVII